MSTRDNCGFSKEQLSVLKEIDHGLGDPVVHSAAVHRLTKMVVDLRRELKKKSERNAQEPAQPRPTPAPKCPDCDGTGMGDYPWECHRCGGRRTL